MFSRETVKYAVDIHMNDYVIIFKYCENVFVCKENMFLTLNITFNCFGIFLDTVNLHIMLPRIIRTRGDQKLVQMPYLTFPRAPYQLQKRIDCNKYNKKNFIIIRRGSITFVQYPLTLKSKKKFYFAFFFSKTKLKWY